MSANENRAVFLSYASQDAAAVLRIAEALRAAGVEVWFDKDELVGGDAWDQKIRRQIKECALFVPVISANTNARAEGYFRLEWKLAVDRSHLMADNAPSLLPVVIDETSDAAARLPDRFREVQWTRLSVKDTPETLAMRVGKLLGGGEVRSGSRGALANGNETRTRTATQRGPAWMKSAVIGGGFLIGLTYALRSVFSPQAGHEQKPAASAMPPAVVAPVAPAVRAVSEGVKFAQRAKALYDKAGFGRDDLVLADDFAKRATDAPRAMPYLRKALNFRETHTDRTLPFDPWWDKLRGQPEFEALLAEAKARVEQKKQ